MNGRLIRWCILWLAIAGSCDAAPTTAPTTAPEVPADWQTFTIARAFKFRAPADMTAEEVTGTDSLVGLYRSRTLELNSDYGYFSDSLKEEQGAEYRELQVGGKNARMKWKNDWVAIHFPGLHGKTTLTVLVKYQEGSREIAEMILRSIEFPKPGEPVRER